MKNSIDLNSYTAKGKLTLHIGLIDMPAPFAAYLVSNLVEHLQRMGLPKEIMYRIDSQIDGEGPMEKELNRATREIKECDDFFKGICDN